MGDEGSYTPQNGAPLDDAFPRDQLQLRGGILPCLLSDSRGSSRIGQGKLIHTRFFSIIAFSGDGSIGNRAPDYRMHGKTLGYCTLWRPFPLSPFVRYGVEQQLPWRALLCSTLGTAAAINNSSWYRLTRKDYDTYADIPDDAVL